MHGNHRPYRLWKIKWKAAQDFSLFVSFIMLIIVLVFAITYICRGEVNIYTYSTAQALLEKYEYNSNDLQYSLLAALLCNLSLLCSVISHCSALSFLTALLCHLSLLCSVISTFHCSALSFLSALLYHFLISLLYPLLIAPILPCSSIIYTLEYVHSLCKPPFNSFYILPLLHC